MTNNITNELKKAGAEILLAIASEYLQQSQQQPQQAQAAQQAQQAQQVQAPQAAQQKKSTCGRVAEADPRSYTDEEIARKLQRAQQRAQQKAQYARRDDKREYLHTRVQQQQAQHARRDDKCMHTVPHYIEVPRAPQEKPQMKREEVFQEGYSAGVVSLGITLFGAWVTNRATIWVENFFKKEAGLRS